MKMKNKPKSPPTLEGYYYSPDQARRCRDQGHLLSIRVETSLRCNLRCRYCCNRSGMPLKNEISYEKIVSLIDEAKKLGAKSVIVIGGGEPTIYPKFKKLIQYIANKNLVPVIFTNTQTMTVELAKFLFKHNVSVITKIDSLDEKIQDELVGSSGALKRIMRGIYNLQKVGYE